jgi:hypothetical protein
MHTSNNPINKRQDHIERNLPVRRPFHLSRAMSFVGLLDGANCSGASIARSTSILNLYLIVDETGNRKERDPQNFSSSVGSTQWMKRPEGWEGMGTVVRRWQDDRVAGSDLPWASVL